MFILPTGEHFWGHDRMEWALRHGYVERAEAWRPASVRFLRGEQMLSMDLAAVPALPAGAD